MSKEAKRPILYWDACVLLDYVDAKPGRIEIIADILDRAEKGECEIITSMLTIAEVAYAQEERSASSLDRDVEAKISLLHPDSPLRLVEMHQLVATEARQLIRAAVVRGWSLKPPDAIHLATAQRHKVVEFHTYERKMRRWAPLVGFPIREPNVEQGNLFVAAAMDGAAALLTAGANPTQQKQPAPASDPYKVEGEADAAGEASPET